MPAVDVLLQFVVATALYAYMPGPSMIYAAAQTLARGRRAGWMAAFGIHLGGYVHVIAATLGLSVLFSSVPVLYSIFKFLGAGYLIWLGVQIFLSRELPSDINIECRSGRRPMKTFWDSIVVEVLNPKTAIFYIAFLPLFTDPAAVLPLWMQLLILGTLVNIAFSSAEILCVLLASTVMDFLRMSPRANQKVQRVGGSLLIGLGVYLAISGR